MTELREEGGSMLETLLTLIASHTISRLVNWCCHSHGLFTPTNQNISLNLIKLFVINRKPQNKSKMWIYCCLYLLSVNLMAALGSLSAIARQRPAFMAIVVQAFESLHGIVRLSYNYSECVAGKMLSSKLTLTLTSDWHHSPNINITLSRETFIRITEMITNRTIARWRYLTTTTTIHFGFALLFKFVNPAEDYRTIALICIRKQQTQGFW